MTLRRKIMFCFISIFFLINSLVMINSGFAGSEIDCNNQKKTTQEFLDKYINIHDKMVPAHKEYMEKKTFTPIMTVSNLLNEQDQMEHIWDECYSKDATQEQKELFQETTKKIYAMGKDVLDGLKKK